MCKIKWELGYVGVHCTSLKNQKAFRGRVYCSPIGFVTSIISVDVQTSALPLANGFRGLLVVGNFGQTAL